jgi:hypothetical protein
MLRLLRAISLIGLLLSGRAAAQTFTISGTVVEHGTSRPLKDAIVSISPVQQPQDSASCRTGEDGRFVFTPVAPGKYSLSAQKRGFPRQTFDEYQEFSTAIVAGPGLNSENIVFPLSAGGSITGTVLDDENEPIRQASVILFRKGVSSGAARVTMQEQRQSDSSGQFRFAHLKPGSYFVAVQARPWYAQNLPLQPQSSGNEQSNSDGELDVAYPLTYYSGTVDPASASAITVNEGATNNLQMLLRPVPALHIQVTGAPTNAGTGPGTGLNLMSLTLGGYRWFAQAQVSVSNGQMQIAGIAPGRYIIVPVSFGEGHPESLGAAVVDFTGNDTLDFSVLAGRSLTGHITFGGTESPPRHAMLVLYPVSAGPPSIIAIDPDGTLKHSEGSPLLPGRYQLWLQNAPGLYLKSVQVNGAEVSAGQIEIPNSGAIQLSLVAAKGLTNIDGMALKEDKPLAGAMVLLIPKEFGRAELIRRDQSDSDGTFTLSDVPPGHYTLLAIDDGRDLLYQDPAVMKPYLSQGRNLTVPLPNGAPVKVEVLARQAPAGQSSN